VQTLGADRNKDSAAGPERFFWVQTVQTGTKTVQTGTKTVQTGTKTVQTGTKTVQTGTKTVQRAGKEFWVQTMDDLEIPKVGGK